MIKEDFINYLLSISKTYTDAEHTGSKYININSFIVRISDHFTTKTKTHDLDIIFFTDDKYIIYPTNALFKKPEYCETVEQGVEFIQGWMKYGAPYVKGPTSASYDINDYTNIEEQEEQPDTDACKESDYKIIFEALKWKATANCARKLKWKRLVSATKCIITAYKRSEIDYIVDCLKGCECASIDNRIEWIKNTFGITEEEISELLQ